MRTGFPFNGIVGRPRSMGLAALAALPLVFAAVTVSASDAPIAVDMMPVSSIPGAPAGGAAFAETPVETQVRYRAHRSPVRGDSLAISVTTLDGERELKIEIPGLEGISFNMVCRQADGARIACGSRARIQFVNLIARNEITCRQTASGQGTPKIRSCEIAGQDLAEWMVRNGIARSADGAAHREAMQTARQAEAGMWADAELRKGFVVAGK
jgi:endonuclease YncB( thermonuclease family)